MEDQIVPSGFEGIAPQPLIDRYASVIKELTDPSYILHLVELDLRRLREVVTEDDKVELVPFGNPLMNDEGISNVLARIRPILTNNAVLNNLTEDKINSIMMELADSLIQDLMVNKRRYGIKNPSDRDLILDIVLIPVYLALNRSLGEGERRFWGSRPGVAEQQQKPSIFNPFRRG